MLATMLRVGLVLSLLALAGCKQGDKEGNAGQADTAKTAASAATATAAAVELRRRKSTAFGGFGIEVPPSAESSQYEKAAFFKWKVDDKEVLVGIETIDESAYPKSLYDAKGRGHIDADVEKQADGGYFSWGKDLDKAYADRYYHDPVRALHVSCKGPSDTFELMKKICGSFDPFPKD